MTKRWIAFLALLIASTTVTAVELIKWERVPLSVALRVDQERIVFVDRNVRVGMDRAVNDKLRVESLGGAIYIRAADEIQSARLQVQVIETGEIILLDLHTVDDDSQIDTSENIKIVDGRQYASIDDDEPQGFDRHEAKVAESLKIPAPVALTRYASQSLYAPLRTVEPVPGLRKVGLKVNSRLRLFPTEHIIGYPMVAYKLGNYTVSAVKLVNTGKDRIALDPRKLQGDFHSATFQHQWVGGAGTADDTTVVYLITKNTGLEKSLLPHSLMATPPDGGKSAKKADAKKAKTTSANTKEGT